MHAVCKWSQVILMAIIFGLIMSSANAYLTKIILILLCVDMTVLDFAFRPFMIVDICSSLRIVVFILLIL